MLRSRSAMRKRWRQKSNLESIQDFVIEDLSIEIPRAQPRPYTSHLDSLSFLRASTPVPVLPRPIERLPCSSAANIVSLPSLSQALDYMSLKIAADLIPRFDGTFCSFTAFIKQCRDVDSRVKPADRVNLLTVAIRYKIKGHAKLLIENHKTPNTLDELISLLKTVFEQTFDVDRIQDELNRLRQGRSETVRTYGARVSEILSRSYIRVITQHTNEHRNRGQLCGGACDMEMERGLAHKITLDDGSSTLSIVSFPISDI